MSGTGAGATAASVLVTTYTMDRPAAVVGVFFRALRLGHALRRRGHRVTVANRGPLPGDPKVDAARAAGIAIAAEPWDGAHRAEEVHRFFAAAEPDLVVIGEGPFDTMETSFAVAVDLGVPTILLDQYYQRWLVKVRAGLDRVLLYGLASLLAPDELTGLERVALVPPFIDEVAPPAAVLGNPASPAGPTITVLGFDRGVHDRGIALAGRALAGRALAGRALAGRALAGRALAGHEAPARVVVVGQPTAVSEAVLAEHGLSAHGVAIGRVGDAALFGALALADTAIVANGYMQILEALALATPVVVLGRGVGLEGWTVDDRLRPYVSIEEDEDTRVERLRGWLAASPFAPDLARRLAAERRGAEVCADVIGQLLAARAGAGP